MSYARWVLAPTLPEEPTEPRSSYFVCGTPRSGTWLLCGLLASTGAAGRPHEYFERGTEEPAARAWGTRTFQDYLRAVLAAGTTANGVVGVKVMWAAMEGLLERLRGTSPSCDRDVLEEVFPRLRFVWLRRGDTVAQAVSWSRAIQTGHWHVWDAQPTVEPRFDFAQIDALRREISEHDDAWRRWFDHNGIDPLEVRFEDLAHEPERTARQVLTWLEVDLPDGVTIVEQTQKVGDFVKDEWTRRFRVVSGARPELR